MSNVKSGSVNSVSNNNNSKGAKAMNKKNSSSSVVFDVDKYIAEGIIIPARTDEELAVLGNMRKDNIIEDAHIILYKDGIVAGCGGKLSEDQKLIGKQIFPNGQSYFFGKNDRNERFGLFRECFQSISEKIAAKYNWSDPLQREQGICELCGTILNGKRIAFLLKELPELRQKDKNLDKKDKVITNGAITIYPDAIVNANGGTLSPWQELIGRCLFPKGVKSIYNSYGSERFGNPRVADRIKSLADSLRSAK